MANHYGMAMIPARPGKPKDKAKVERAVAISYYRIFAPLRKQTFYSVQELNTALLEQSGEQHALISTRDWVNKAENLMITGPTGVGESHLASAIGHQCCQMRLKVAYHNAQKLFQALRLARLDGTQRRQMQLLACADLLILDDFGLQRPDELAKLDLLEWMEDRHGRKSMIISVYIHFTRHFYYALVIGCLSFRPKCCRIKFNVIKSSVKNFLLSFSGLDI